MAKQSGVNIEQQFTQEIFSSQARLFCSIAMSQLFKKLRAGEYTDIPVEIILLFISDFMELLRKWINASILLHDQDDKTVKQF